MMIIFPLHSTNVIVIDELWLIIAIIRRAVLSGPSQSSNFSVVKHASEYLATAGGWGWYGWSWFELLSVV